MYLNKAQIKAVKVALDVMDIMLVYDGKDKEIQNAKDELEKLKAMSEQKHKK